MWLLFLVVTVLVVAQLAAAGVGRVAGVGTAGRLELDVRSRSKVPRLLAKTKEPVDIGDDPEGGGDKRALCEEAAAAAAVALTLRGGSSSSSSGVAAVDWRYFVAGGLCASISHGWTTPLDVIKTKMQQSPEKYTAGMIAAARAIVAAEGAGVLLTGLAPTVVGYGLEGAVKFGLYEAFKSLLSPLSCLDGFSAKLLASVIAGAFAAVLLCPMEEARIKMVGDASWARENLVSAMARLLLQQEGGVLSTFAGLPAMLLKQIPYTMGKQVSFDIIAEALYALTSPGRGSGSGAKGAGAGAGAGAGQLAGLVTALGLGAGELRWTISVVSAFLASIFACLFSQPGDVLLTATYGSSHGHGSSDKSSDKSSSSSSSKPGLAATIAAIHARHGLGGFFAGLPARLSHVASIITSQLVVNDLVKTALGLPATGAH